MSNSYDNANPPHVWEQPTHACSRIGCTRLTAEQECAIHAVKWTGPKEPRRTAIEEVIWLASHRYGSGDPLVKGALAEVAGLRAENERLSTYKERLRGECVGALTEAGRYMLVSPEDPTGPGEVSRAIDALAAERDEWKRRAEEAQSDAVRIVQVHQHEWVMRASAREAFENYVVRVMAASGADSNFDDCFRNIIAEYDKSLARADKAEAERDAAIRRCDKLEAFITYIESPALKAWRALDAEERANTVEDLKTWADLVERGLGDGGTGTHRGLFAAASCLEALAEPRP